MNATPTWPVAVNALVITGVGGLIVSTSVAVPVPPAFVALKLTEKGLPVFVVGVPEIRPVPVLTDSPAGKPVALKLVGLFVAVIW